MPQTCCHVAVNDAGRMNNFSCDLQKKAPKSSPFWNVFFPHPTTSSRYVFRHVRLTQSPKIHFESAWVYYFNREYLININSPKSLE